MKKNGWDISGGQTAGPRIVTKDHWGYPYLGKKLMTNVENYVMINYLICVKNAIRQVEGLDMVKNNIEIDVKIKCIEKGMTQVQLAERADTDSQYVNR